MRAPLLLHAGRLYTALYLYGTGISTQTAKWRNVPDANYDTGLAPVEDYTAGLDPCLAYEVAAREFKLE